ncbi:MAG: methionine adenosyltransferase [Ignavibacteria bacterium]|nr:methionine adenosyltransferase [Ignavibacteria bacterium]
MSKKYLFSSESVSEGHPDKVADQISDAILDEYLKVDNNAKVACETLLSDNLVVISGEFNSKRLPKTEIPEIAKSVIKEIGYNKENGIDADACTYVLSIKQQCHEINRAVTSKKKTGAGDQGLMFGYASNETKELMPMPILLAHKLLEYHAKIRQTPKYSFLYPDAKSQVTILYEDNKPIAVKKVVFSTQHSKDIKLENLRKIVRSDIIKPVLENYFNLNGVQYLINPGGTFNLGGPKTDTGLTGRKIIVDTYGGSCPHGGGAFSGKDATKVDRSAAYIARYIAKNIVATRIAERCTVQLAYAIGQENPVSFMLDFHGTSRYDEAEIQKQITKIIDLTPSGIIKKLKLNSPIFRKTAAYGHFGRELPEFLWEKKDWVSK